jgi:hypothetical protein
MGGGFKEYQEQYLAVAITVAVSVLMYVGDAFLQSWGLPRRAMVIMTLAVFAVLFALVLQMVPTEHWLGGSMSRQERMIRRAASAMIVGCGLVVVFLLQRR